jgi:hypothetical protein
MTRVGVERCGQMFWGWDFSGSFDFAQDDGVKVGGEKRGWLTFFVDTFLVSCL